MHGPQAWTPTGDETSSLRCLWCVTLHVQHEVAFWRPLVAAQAGSCCSLVFLSVSLGTHPKLGMSKIGTLQMRYVHSVSFGTNLNTKAPNPTPDSSTQKNTQHLRPQKGELFPPGKSLKNKRSAPLTWFNRRGASLHGAAGLRPEDAEPRGAARQPGGWGSELGPPSTRCPLSYRSFFGEGSGSGWFPD